MINGVSNYFEKTFPLSAHKDARVNPAALTSSINTNKKSKEQSTDKAVDADKFGLRLAKAALLTGLIVFIMLRGAPRKFRSKLDQANKNLFDLKVGENTRIGLKYKFENFLKRLASYSKAIFNLAPLKDVVIAKILKLSNFTDKISQRITNKFEEISVKTLTRSYKNTNEKFETLFADFAEANNKLPQNVADEINKKIETIRKIYTEGFSTTARRKRLNTIKLEFDGFDEKGNKIGDSLMERVWNDTYKNFLKFLKESAYTNFVSEEVASKTKINNATKINNYKFLISNSLNSLCEDSFNLLIHLDTFIEHSDTDARPIIKKIAKPLNKYKNIVKDHGDAKDILLDGNISRNLEELDNVFKKSNKYDKKTLEEVSSAIKSLRTRLDYNKRGEINEIMKIYDEYLPIEDRIKLKKKAYETTDSLERSVDLETDKLFDKIRDLKIGSAPKDTLGVLASFGVMGYGLSKAENNEEKVSVAIKYGIPTVGAVAIMVYCTVGLISAGPSLLVGLLSGLAMNQVGTVVDNFRKKVSKKYQVMNGKQ